MQKHVVQMQAKPTTCKFSGGTEVFQYPGGSTIKFSIRQPPLKMPNSLAAIFWLKIFQQVTVDIQAF